MPPENNPLIVNPYIAGSPVKDATMFFGREDVYAWLRQHLHGAYQDNIIVLYGERRSGKTSLLLWLMNRKADPEAPPDDSIYIYLSPELGVRDPETFTEEVFRALREQDCSCPEPSGKSPSYFALRRCVARLAPRKLVILLDEFDTMVMSGLFPTEFFASLRGLAQTHDVSYVTTTREDLFQCCPEEVLASPFPNIFRPAYIGSFEASEFDHFIEETSRRSGVSLEPCKQHVLSLGGRYPFFVQIACCHSFELLARGDALDASAHEQIQTSFEDEAQRHMTVIWDRYLSDEERETMCSLCQGRYGDPSVLHELTRKGYVVDGRVFSSLLEKMARQQREALSCALKAPLMVTNVLIRDWKSFERLGLEAAYCPGSYHTGVRLGEPVSMGEYRCPRTPDEPTVLQLGRIPLKPGLPAPEQWKAGRKEWAPFETYERKVRDQLGRMLSAGGLDPARDIEAITVNRWSHGYAYGYDPVSNEVDFASDWPEERRTWLRARRPFGRIAIANSDAGANAMTETAIGEAHRAVREILG